MSLSVANSGLVAHSLTGLIIRGPSGGVTASPFKIIVGDAVSPPLGQTKPAKIIVVSPTDLLNSFTVHRGLHGTRKLTESPRGQGKISRLDSVYYTRERERDRERGERGERERARENESVKEIEGERMRQRHSLRNGLGTGHWAAGSVYKDEPRGTKALQVLYNDMMPFTTALLSSPTGVPLYTPASSSSHLGGATIQSALAGAIPGPSTAEPVIKIEYDFVFSLAAAIPGPSTVEPIIKMEYDLALSQWPGEYGFNLRFEELPKYKKNWPCCFSSSRDIVIVKDGVPIPFTFTSTSSISGLQVRVHAVFTSPEYFSSPVKPCNNHKSTETPEFLMCPNEKSFHVQDDSGRHGIVIPLDSCRDDTKRGVELQEMFTFNCRSSCTVKGHGSGINNRHLSLVFILETSDAVPVGRRAINLKVSVSPGRDMTTLLKDRKRSRSEASTASGAGSPSLGETNQAKRMALPGVSDYHVIVKCTKKVRRYLQSLANVCDERYMRSPPNDWKSIVKPKARRRFLTQSPLRWDALFKVSLGLPIRDIPVYDGFIVLRNPCNYNVAHGCLVGYITVGPLFNGTLGGKGFVR
eukprot:sb/3463355/